MTTPNTLFLYATGPFQPFNFTDCLSYAFPPGTNSTNECHREEIIERVARGYFTFAMINSVYIILTTGLYIRRSYSLEIHLPTPRDSDAESVDQSNDYGKNLWRRRALLQRGLLSTVFSGLGNFIITSTLLFKQAFDVEFLCFIYFGLIYIGYFIWIFSFVWRGMRLRFLLKLNEVKITESRPEKRVSVSKWLTSNRDMHVISDSRYLKIFLVLSVALIVYLGVIQHYSFAFRTGSVVCQFGWESYLITAVLVSYLIVCIVAVFFLWNKEDANGIRTDLMISAASGIPCMICLFLFLELFPVGDLVGQTLVRIYFGSTNFLVIAAEISHFVSTVWPLLKSYGLSFPILERRRDEASSHSKKDQEAHTHTLKHQLEHTVASLSYVLKNPTLFQELLNFTAKDFCSENSLFFERYLSLMQHVDTFFREVPSNQSLSNDPMVIERVFSDGPETTTSNFGVSTNYSATTTSSMGRKNAIQVGADFASKYASEIVPQELAPEFLNFYETFIIGNLQVNLESDTLNKIRTAFGISDSYSSQYWSVSPISPFVPNFELSPLSTTKVNMSSTKISVFDDARDEVFWILFSGSYPNFLNRDQ